MGTPELENEDMELAVLDEVEPTDVVELGEVEEETAVAVNAVLEDEEGPEAAE